MQTFLPYPDFRRSLETLDKTRLGNQIYREGLTLVRGGWKNHPISKMWKGYEFALCTYCLIGLDVLSSRGRHYPHWIEYFTNKRTEYKNTGMPSWIGDEEFHRSHRLNLLFKNPEHYSKYFNEKIPQEKPEYIWRL